MNFWVILIIFAVLAFGDKAITAVNIHQANKNFPEAMKKDPYQVELNPVAKWFFNKFGLIGGTVIYFFISIPILFFAYRLLSIPFGENTSLYILMILMGFVIMNNLYFLLKFSKVIV